LSINQIKYSYGIIFANIYSKETTSLVPTVDRTEFQLYASDQQINKNQLAPLKLTVQ